MNIVWFLTFWTWNPLKNYKIIYGISTTAFFTSYIINNRGSLDFLNRTQIFGVTPSAVYIQITKNGLGRAHGVYNQMNKILLPWPITVSIVLIQACCLRDLNAESTFDRDVLCTYKEKRSTCFTVNKNFYKACYIIKLI